MQRRFDQKIRLRNSLEYIGIAALLPLCWPAWSSPHWDSKVGAALLVTGGLYVGFQLHRRGSARSLSARATADATRAHHRGELTRQYELLHDIWRWYLGPLVPGAALLTLAGAWRAFRQGVPIVLALLPAVITALVFFGIATLNQRAARKLQTRIRELDAPS